MRSNGRHPREHVLTELQRTCLDAQDFAQNKLQDWLKRVVCNLQEVKVLKTWVKTPLCLRARNATDFIPTRIHPRELNLNWLTKVNDDMLSLRNFYVNIITFWSSQGDLSSKKSKKTEENGQDKNVARLDKNVTRSGKA